MTNRRVVSVGWGLSVLTALVFLAGALPKLGRMPAAVEGMTRVGFPLTSVAPIGLLEISCLVLYLVPRTCVLGTLLLTGFLGGAIVTQILGRESVAVPVVVGLVGWPEHLSGLPGFAGCFRWSAATQH